MGREKCFLWRIQVSTVELNGVVCIKSGDATFQPFPGAKRPGKIVRRYFGAMLKDYPPDVNNM